MKARTKSAPVVRSDQDYVSIWFWMFAQFLLLLPLVNFIAIPLLAFVGENRSRKNFFRAMLVWLGLIVLLDLTVFIIGAKPEILTWFRDVWKMVADTLFP